MIKKHLKGMAHPFKPVVMLRNADLTKVKRALAKIGAVLVCFDLAKKAFLAKYHKQKP